MKMLVMRACARIAMGIDELPEGTEVEGFLDDEGRLHIQASIYVRGQLGAISTTVSFGEVRRTARPGGARTSPRPSRNKSGRPSGAPTSCGR